MSSLLCAGMTLAQVPLPFTQAEAQARLAEKGLTEEEVKVRLKQKGWDLDNPDSIDPSRYPELQRVIQETVDELAREKVQAAKPKAEVQPPKPEPVVTRDTVTIKKDTAVQPPPVSDEIYGHHLFQGRDLNVFRQSSDIRPPDSYVLGTGDVLLLQIYGPAQVQSTYTIDDLGYIQVRAELPRIALKGLTLKDARVLLRERLRRFFTYSDDQFSVTVQQPRTITINFFGEVETTGGISLPAVNTIFNALAAAGGPSDIGSVRNIKLISGNQERVFDLYKFMNDPRTAEAFYLQDNDYVHIPVAERVVRISGAVHRPFRYELVKGENLLKLVEYAGGTNPNAYLKDVQITRYTNDQRIVVSVNLRALRDSGGDYILYQGDEVSISSLDKELRFYVEVRGAVVKEGKYEYVEGMRVADLLEKGTVLSEARRDFGYILRFNQNGTYSYLRFNPDVAMSDRGSGDNLLLSPRDIVNIESEKSYADATYISVEGSVRKPSRFIFEPGELMRVQDAILISGGLSPSAANFGYLIRRRLGDPKNKEYLPFNPLIADQDPTSYDNLALEPMDSIYIFDKRKLEDAFFVRVSGAVRNPGLFPYTPDLTLNKILQLAGGFTFSAATNRIDISRVIVQENEPTQIQSLTTQVDRESLQSASSMGLLPHDHIIVREVPEFELERTVYVAGEVRFPGIYSIVSSNERISSFIQRAGGLTEEAFADGARLYRAEDSIGVVILNLQEGLSRQGSASDIILRHQDTLMIPKRQELVTISGAVNFRDVYDEEYIEGGNKINVGFVPNKRAMYYINAYAAGIADNGRRKLVSVRHANGRLERTVSLGFVNIYPKVTPGATINVATVVPRVIEVEGEKKPVDWGVVIRDTIAQATAVLTLILLLERVN
jgi:protein involved in polysaccharide export with SLBB domain